jgi:hypothetical protein
MTPMDYPLMVLSEWIDIGDRKLCYVEAMMVEVSREYFPYYFGRHARHKRL